jgi:hypothetical protein
MKLKKTVLFALLAIVAAGTMMGCRKKKDTIAIIYVRDASNQPVANAQVVLYGVSTTGQPSSVTLYDTTFSNSAGEAEFNFNEVYQLGQAGVAVLNIAAKKDALTGQGIIKIEEETTSEETVFIQ